MTDTAVAPNNRAIVFQSKPTRERAMGKLNAARRNALPPKDFAGPGRTYPDEDPGHARDALARVSEFGTPAVKAEVRRNVKKDWPGMKIKSLKKSGQISEKQASRHGL